MVIQNSFLIDGYILLGGQIRGIVLLKEDVAPVWQRNPSIDTHELHMIFMGYTLIHLSQIVEKLKVMNPFCFNVYYSHAIMWSK